MVVPPEMKVTFVEDRAPILSNVLNQQTLSIEQ